MGASIVGTDLADNPRAYASAIDAFENVSDDFVRKLVGAFFVDVPIIVRLAVPATAHDDIEAGFFGDTAQGAWIATHVPVGEIDDGAATRVTEAGCLDHGQ